MVTIARGLWRSRWLVTALTACISWPTIAHAAGPQKKVLVLNSTRHDEQFSVVSEREVPRRLVADLQEPVDYYTEYFDGLRFPQPEYESVYVDYLRRKYDRRHFDLLILMGGVAMEFMVRNRNVLFAGIPTVFYSFDPPTTQLANSTGLVNPFHFNRSIELARALQPDLQNVFVVTGKGPSDRRFERQVRAEFQRFDRLEFTYLSGLATRDLEIRLRTLPPHSAVFYMLVSEDGAGEQFQQMSYLSLVAAAANVPTYSWADAAVDTGIVGGNRRDHLAETTAIARLAVRVLKGERADQIPVSSPDTDVDQVDWRQLRRWGISEARLPAGARLLFREPTMWDRYKGYIIGALALLMAQTALIAGLLVQRVKRRKAEVELRGSETKLRASYDRIRYLGRRLLTAQEVERAYLGRELHDDISQQLAILSVELDALRSNPSQIEGENALSRAMETAHSISMSVHQLSHWLHPTKLQLLGIVAALNNLQRDFSGARPSITFSHRDVPSLDADLALCLFRVAQESVRNAVKHGDANHVSITLTGSTSGVTLKIADDGKGFDVEAVANDGLGLVSMRERVESAGGTLQVRSKPGEGTQIVVEVPARVVTT